MSDFCESVCYYITRSIVTLKSMERTMICLKINDVGDDTFRMDFESFFSGHIISSQEYACLVSIDELYYLIAYNYSSVSDGVIDLNFDIRKYSDRNEALNDFNSLENI
jgi:hypothetical protein